MIKVLLAIIASLLIAVVVYRISLIVGICVIFLVALYFLYRILYKRFQLWRSGPGVSRGAVDSTFIYK